MPPGTQTRTIHIKVDSGGVKEALDKMAASMGNLNKNTKSISSNMSFLSNAFRGWLGYVSFREIIKISDSMQSLGNRLKIVTNDGVPAMQVLDNIRGIAKRTYQPLSDVAEAYARMGSALKNVGANSDQLGALTETLVNTFRVAGTTVTETTNTMIQLSQAFSSGEVRGQELRSVLEQNAVLAGYLRKEYGKDLMKVAADGMIRASDITRVLIKNFDELQAQAKNLTPTFEQSVATAMTDFQFAVHNVNTDLGLSLKFFKGMTWVVENFGTIAAGAAAGGITMLMLSMGGLATSIITVGKALAAAFFGSNPFGWAVLAGVAVAALVHELGGLENTVTSFKIIWTELNAEIYKVDVALMNFIGASKKAQKSADEVLMAEARANGYREEMHLRELDRQNKEKGKDKAAKEYLKTLYDTQKAYEGASGKPGKLKDELGLLNRQLEDGIIGWSQYQEKLSGFELHKANKEFREGKKDAYAYHEQLQKIKEMGLNRLFADGSIGLRDMNIAIGESKVQILQEQFEGGRISLTNYNKEMNRLNESLTFGARSFYEGTQSYIDSVGTLSSNVAKGIEQAFGHLETNFIEFTKNGQFNFKQFTQSVLDDLTAIIIKAAIIRPLAQGILDFSFGASYGAGGGGQGMGGLGGGSRLMAAKGHAFDNGNLVAFAKGGIVDSPTAFSFGGGKRGVMGEAGTEAILPLARGANGNLGVQASTNPVTVNIINKAGADVQTEEKTGPKGEKILEVLILNTVKTGFAQGSFDTTMKNNYNMTRKGY